MFSSKELFIDAYINRLEDTFGISYKEADNYQKYVILATLVKEYALNNWTKSKEVIKNNHHKQVYYFSMEFLMGRLLTNNLINLGIYDVVSEAMEDLGFNLNEIENKESDIGLGNGGLGRLAACFLDSIASLSYPGHGVCIRYRKGFFEQKFIDGNQVELPEKWLENDFVWETKHENESVLVPFYGVINTKEADGKLVFRHDEAVFVEAIPYEVPIIGYHNNVVNSLILWDAKPCGDNEEDYKIADSLYPNDSTEEGKILRLKQQYFFVCSGLRRIVNQHKQNYQSMDNFHEKVTLHINDTHPTLLIPELMRILIDEEGYSWDKAWHITQNTCAYTNHTILAEALEKWDVNLIKRLLPRIYLIIEELDKRYNAELMEHFGDDKKRINSLRIINNNLVHMAHICIYGSFSVNGVALLHTKILKEVEMKDFNEIYPHKFNNKTNGITHRRWLFSCNPLLSNFLNKYIGKSWITDINQLARLNDFVSNPEVKKDFFRVKQGCKEKLADFIEKKEGIRLNVDSIFDVHVKRLHEYKRQLMNALHIMYLYNRLREDSAFYQNFHPQTFIFGAKAAGSYYMAKKIIKLINTIADKVNNDETVNDKIKVVFVENYNVSYAEIIIPAANVSEQISTATKEASGTGNMKFMMNGAITIGTLDGANVEIVDLVGMENAFIFGLRAEEANEYYKNKSYNSREVYDNDNMVKTVVDMLVNGFFTNVGKDEFKPIHDDLLNKDYFFVLKDFRAYVEAQRKVNELYKNQDKWLEIALKNISNSSYFSSDRTITEYASEIWNLRKMSL